MANSAVSLNIPDPATQADMETATDVTKVVTPGRAQFHPSASKAWGTCDLTGALGMSYNVTSVTDSSTSIKIFNFTVSFSAATYTATQIQYNSNIGAYNPNWCVQSRSAGSVTINNVDEGNNNTNIGMIALGDQ